MLALICEKTLSAIYPFIQKIKVDDKCSLPKRLVKSPLALVTNINIKNYSVAFVNMNQIDWISHLNLKLRIF